MSQTICKNEKTLLFREKSDIILIVQVSVLGNYYFLQKGEFIHMNIKNKKGNRTTRFLIGSFSLLLLVSAGGFLGLGYYMNRDSEKAIHQVGDLYMTGMNEQITAHFQTLINLKLEQADTVVKVVPPEGEDTDEIYEELIYRVSVRNFDYLALCASDGSLEMLLGQQIELADPEPFYESIRNHEQKVAVGKDELGNEVVIFGINAEYPLENGERSIAILAALPIEYISTMLGTEGKDSLMYSYIIRKDGSFIASDLNGEYADYFTSLYDRYGKEDYAKIDSYVQELTVAMEKRENYSTIMNLGGSNQQVYCTSLPYSEWNLVTILPFGSLNQTVEELGEKTTITTMSVFTVILAALLLIFYVYFKMSRQQLKALEEARLEALQANKAKSEFLSNMSHDIRTPMNAIVGMTAIATAHIDDKEQVHNCLKKIALSGKHLLGLINDVLDMSKIESGKMTLTVERVSLREVVEGIVSIVQTQVKAKGQNFYVHIDRILAEDVYCDGVRLNQVLLNLLSNAVKYTQEGGKIELSLYQEEVVSEGRADGAPEGNAENGKLENDDEFVRTHIIVKDNGIGMTAEFLTHIFDSYSRADSKRVQKTEGAGLGMAIAKYIVDAMHGTISVESKPQEGTTIHLVLDMEKAAVQEIDMILPAWKMLVVDDDEMLCHTAVEALESIGLEAEWTLSGSKAIEMVRSHHQKRDDYQIILLDWKLPDIDGLGVARQIRKIVDMDMPLILISAYDWSDFEIEARDAGISGFISKPLFKSTLFHELRKYMGVEDEPTKVDTDMELTGRHVLVAEDNELNWEILEELLADIGLVLDWAENGEICLQKFQASEEGYYEAILMDVRMPIMNGYESTRAIRALERPDAQTIPIIAMTADAFSEDIQRCLESGMNAHTAKPVNLDEVISLLKKYILNE